MKYKKNKHRFKKSFGDIVFDILNYLFMIILLIVTVYPFYYVVISSISNNIELQAFKGLLLHPLGVNFGAYKLAFSHPLLLTGYKNSLLILFVSLPINIILTLFCAYFMASKNIMFKRPLILFMMFTMYFSGGLIPTYLNIRSLGLYNHLSAIILPSALSLYNAIIAKTAIEAMPESLTESAYIDGANELQILFKIITPLIKPTLAVLLLYYGVSHWNGWFNASIYLVDNDKLPLQNILRSILVTNNDMLGAKSYDKVTDSYTETIKYAVIIISTVPILTIYPFLQKYFQKGVMVGAVKG